MAMPISKRTFKNEYFKTSKTQKCNFLKKTGHLQYCCVKRKALNTKYVCIYIYASFFTMLFTKRDDANFF